MKKNSYNEYFLNDTYLKKLYYIYIHQTKYEKAIEYLVDFAIFFTIVSIILELFVELNEIVIKYIHIFSIIVVFIFLLELFLEYSKAKTKKHFLKEQWIDFILISSLSFYFLFGTYLGFARFEKILKAKNIIQELKHYKILLETIKKKLFK